MEQIELAVQAQEEIEQECKLCGCSQCYICKAELKKERVQNSIFVIGTGISMISFSITLGTGLGFIGLGLTCGTVLSLISSLI